MKTPKNLWRQLLQWGTIAAIVAFIVNALVSKTPVDVEAYCPFGGLQALSTFLVNGTLACSMSMVQIMVGITLGIAIILFSKLFCGYLCPLGTLSESMCRLRKKIKVKEIVIPAGSIADKALRIIKYALLFIVFYFTIGSSELFCKHFDPYYAMATGFKGEITLWMSLVSILLLFCGSFFINMFWCRYICPLGAISNIFKFTLWFVAAILIVAVVSLIGVNIPWVWILAAVCLGFYLIEILCSKTKIFPLLKITRDTNTCISCGLCAKKCPYHINVDKVSYVRNVDCTLCGECVACCPKDSLKINRCKKMRWLPAILVVVLFGAALWLGNVWELPTINERWGDVKPETKLEMLEMTGLRSVKCYGSSKAFSAQMKKVPGVYGVATYVRSHTVHIYYNPAETNQEKVSAAIFAPATMKLNTPPAEVPTLKIVTLGVDKLFDKLDVNYLGMLLKQHDGFYGMKSEYACPVIIRIYVDPKTDVSENALRAIVESEALVTPVHGGGEKTIPCNYVLVTVDSKTDTIGRKAFLHEFFKGSTFNYKKNIEKYADKPTAVYEIEYPALEKPIVTRNLPFLSSHLSGQKGLIKFETLLNSNDVPVIRITFAKEVTDAAKIWAAVTAPKWHIFKSDGTEEDIDAKLTFQNEGKVIE